MQEINKLFQEPNRNISAWFNFNIYQNRRARARRIHERPNHYTVTALRAYALAIQSATYKTSGEAVKATRKALVEVVNALTPEQVNPTLGGASITLLDAGEFETGEKLRDAVVNALNVTWAYSEEK